MFNDARSKLNTINQLIDADEKENAFGFYAKQTKNLPDSLRQGSSLFKCSCECFSITATGDKGGAPRPPSPEYSHKAGLVCKGA